MDVEADKEETTVYIGGGGGGGAAQAMSACPRALGVGEAFSRGRGTVPQTGGSRLSDTYLPYSISA